MIFGILVLIVQQMQQNTGTWLCRTGYLNFLQGWIQKITAFKYWNLIFFFFIKKEAKNDAVLVCSFSKTQYIVILDLWNRKKHALASQTVWRREEDEEEGEN